MSVIHSVSLSVDVNTKYKAKLVYGACGFSKFLFLPQSYICVQPILLTLRAFWKGFCLLCSLHLRQYFEMSSDRLKEWLRASCTQGVGLQQKSEIKLKALVNLFNQLNRLPARATAIVTQIDARSHKSMMEKRPQTEKTMRVALLWTIAPMNKRRQKREKRPRSDIVIGHLNTSALRTLKSLTID